MNHSLVFSQESRQEIIEAIVRYNQEKENLGFGFYAELNEKLSQIAKSPQHYSIRFKNIRTTQIRKFPYLIYFKILDKKSSIIILGVLHTSRNPQIIKQRK